MIVELQENGVEPDIWKIEGVDSQEDCDMIARTARRDGRNGVICVALGRGADDDKVDEWLRAGAPVPGYAGLRDRSQDGGRLKGIPRREPFARGRHAEDRGQLSALREGVRGGLEGAREGMSLKVRKRTWAWDTGGSFPPTMRMRQSLAQFEEAFREEAADSIVRRGAAAQGVGSVPASGAWSARARPGRSASCCSR